MTQAAGRGGVIQTLKQMFRSKSNGGSEGTGSGPGSAQSKLDPYVRGQGPYFMMHQ